MRSDVRSLLLATGVLLLAGTLAWLRLQPPAARRADAPDTVFSAERALGELHAVLGEDPEPHPVGSPANARVRARILARLTELGYRPAVQRAVACTSGRCAVVHNIVAELAGSEPSAVLLTAHYDSVPAGPGAADDGAGVAALLETARALRLDPAPRHGISFLFTDGEEPGLLGARAFNDEPRSEHLRVIVNLEARGTSGPSLMFESIGPNAPLAAWLGHLDRPVTSSLFSAVYERLENKTDLSIFRAEGLAGFNFAFIENRRHYHTPHDDIARLSPASVQHHGDNLLALARALAAADLEPLRTRTDRAVWFDVLALFVVRWPESWSLPLALVAFALVGATAALRMRQLGRSSIKGWLACFGLPVVTMLLGAVIGMVAVATLSREGRPTEEWGAAGLAVRVALWVGAILPCAMWSWIAGRRIDPWVHFAGVWTLWAVLAVATARHAPYASYLFVVPTLLAGLLAVGWRAHRRAPDSAAFLIVTLAPAFAAGCVWFALAFGLSHALGPVGHFAISASIALPVVAALPALARFEPRFGYPLGVLGAVVALPILVAALLPDHDAEHPQRLSIVHYQHHDTAEWWLDASWAPVPEKLRRAASAGAPGPPPLPLQRLTAVATAPAPRIDVRAPEVEILETLAQGDDRRVSVRLRSRRGAHVVGVLVPPEARLVAMHTEKKPLRAVTIQDGRYAGHAMVTIAGIADAGIDIAFGFASRRQRLIVFDLVHQLPAEAAALREARGATGVPAQLGDLSIVAATVAL